MTTIIDNSKLTAKDLEYLQRLKQVLKKILKDYTGMSQKIESELKELGIVLVRSKGHKILILNYKNREYTFSLAGTPGDWRAGKNMVSIICNTVMSGAAA